MTETDYDGEGENMELGRAGEIWKKGNFRRASADELTGTRRTGSPSEGRGSRCWNDGTSPGQLTDRLEGLTRRKRQASPTAARDHNITVLGSGTTWAKMMGELAIRVSSPMLTS